MQFSIHEKFWYSGWIVVRNNRRIEMSINCAVVGLGVMGRLHANVYHQIEEANLVAVCDFHGESSEKYAQKYGVNAYSDIVEMIEKEAVDVVSLATPTKTHFELGKKLLKAGIHVLIEKPITDNIETADELISLSEDKGCHLVVGHIERFNPAVGKLKSLVDSGELGEITSILARRVGLFPTRIKDANVVVDLAVHDIDIMAYLLGRYPQKVTGHSGRALASDRDDYASVFLDFGKQSGFIQANWITPVKIRTLTVTGTAGYAELNYMSQSLTLYRSKVEVSVDQFGQESIQLDEAVPVNIEIERKDPITEEICHFIQVVKGKKEPLVNGSAGRNSLDIALKAIHEMGE